MLVPVVNMRLTGQKISSLRVQRGISVRDLQEMLGIATPQAIYKWQRGDSLPTLDNIVVLAAAFGVTVDEILVCKEQLHLVTEVA